MRLNLTARKAVAGFVLVVWAEAVKMKAGEDVKQITGFFL
tara:strand:- start:44 stop:163 length:120 start_codon:yes stop_codon:yes gene_type:complete